MIPCYRAEGQVADVLRGIPPYVRTIVVVDDASPDASGERVRELGDPRVHLLRHEVNQGVGGATWTGYREAHRLGADVIVKMDADGQMDPEQLPALVAPVLAGEADYAKGNRFLHARELGEMPALRRVGNLGLSFLTKIASGYWNVFDPTNGYTALHASLVPLLEESRLDKRYFFETGLLMELGLLRAVVRDVDIPARYGDETSNLSETQALFGFPPRQLRGFLRRIWVQYFLRDFGLVSLFLVAGLGLTAFGGLFGSYHWYVNWQRDTATPLGTIMIAVLPVIVGVQCLLQAMLLDVQGRPTTTLQAQLRRHSQLRGLVVPRPGRAVPRPSADPSGGPAVDPAGSPAARGERAE